jgi:WXG100 family type VII secretion target
MSGDQPLNVNFVRMAEISAHIGKTVEYMRTQLSELTSHGNRLTANWAGGARTAYDERQRTWTQASTELIDVLGRIQRAVEQSMVDYRATETQNTKLFTAR